MALGSSVDIVKLISEKQLKEWAGWKAFRDGQVLFERGVVEKVSVDGNFVSGQLNLGPRGMRSRFEILENGLVENHCPCRDNQERGLICSHLVAMGLSLLAKGEIKEATRTGDVERIERMVRSAKGTRIRRARKSTPGAMHAALRILFAAGWKEEVAKHALHFTVVLEVDKKRVALDEIMPDQAVYLNRADSELINKLEEIGGGGIKKRMEVSMAQWVDILPHVSSDTIQVGKKATTLSLNKKVIETEAEMDLDRDRDPFRLRSLSLFY